MGANDKTVEVYYFSGTGNSLVVARDLARHLGARLVPIAAVSAQGEVTTTADTICIVYPVYFTDLPSIVARFAVQLSCRPGTYVAGIATYGGGTGISFTTFRGIFRSCSGIRAAVFGVHMPQNAFRKPWESCEKIFRARKKKAARIADFILRNRRGMLLSDLTPFIALYPLSSFLRRLCVRDLRKKTGSNAHTTVEEMSHKLDRSYKVNARCTGCGQCARVCPVDNIQIVDNRPFWLGHCENCLACYNWCPLSAIEGGVASAGYHYRHPEVNAADMEGQKVL